MMRQRDIDQENAVLLNKIMSIMKRKNKSIMQARQNINNLSVSLNQGENQKKSLNATHCLFPQSKT
jgi:Mg2+/Co2+ transporter CorC